MNYWKVGVDGALIEVRWLVLWAVWDWVLNLIDCSISLSVSGISWSSQGVFMWMFGISDPHIGRRLVFRESRDWLSGTVDHQVKSSLLCTIFKVGCLKFCSCRWKQFIIQSHTKSLVKRFGSHTGMYTCHCVLWGKIWTSVCCLYVEDNTSRQFACHPRRCGIQRPETKPCFGLWLL